MGIPLLILSLPAILTMVQLPVPRQASDSAGAVPALEKALEGYTSLTARGGWPVLRVGSLLRPGMSDVRIAALRHRLELEGYRKAELPLPEVFDSALEDAVRRFQALHGLEPDGVVGPATLAVLNVPAETRLHQIAANLARERTRGLSPGDRYLLVNIPAFTLDLVEWGRSTLQLRIIVGRADWPTPAFSSVVEYLVFRPLWTIPPSIVAEEILPLARSDPRYFAQTGTRVFLPAVRGGAEVDPATVNWKGVPSRRIPYQLIQEPGPLNPLGGVKLVFRSPFAVFLHDTPVRGLFSRPRRAFSHGCVRVEGIEQLVAYLLPDWPSDSIQSALTTGREHRVRVPDPIPIHLVYRTAWVESDGFVAFRDDVYRLDRKSTERKSALPARTLHPVLNLAYSRTTECSGTR